MEEQIEITEELIKSALEYKNNQILNVSYKRNLLIEKFSKIISALLLLGLIIIPFGLVYFICSKFFNTEYLLLYFSYNILKVSAIYLCIILLFKFIFEIVRFAMSQKKFINDLGCHVTIEIVVLTISFLYAIVSTIIFNKTFGYDNRPIIGNDYNREGLYAVIMYAIVFFAAFSIDHTSIKKLFIYIMLLVGLLVSVAYLIIPIIAKYNVNAILLYRYMNGPFNNSNHFGYYTCIISLIAAGLIVYSEKKVDIVIGGIFIIPFELCLLKSNTLGSNIGFVFGLVFIVLSYVIKNKKFSWKIILLVLVSLIVFISSELTGYTNMLGDYVRMNNGISAIAQDATSETAIQAGSSRWGLWLRTIECIKKAPWIGKGLDCYYDLNIYDNLLDMPHNEYLQIASNVGLPVALLYVVALIITFIRAIKYRHFLSNTNLICLSVTFGYCVSAFFGNTFLYTYPYFLIFWAFSIPRVNIKLIKLEYKRN